MKLRSYQREAVEAIKNDLKLPDASLVIMPTGSGKSHVIAATASLAKKVLILQPSQELLKQNYAKLALIVGEKEIGIYSASFNKKQIRRFTFATIQSIYKKGELFKGFELVLVDEAHGIAPRAIDTMYMQLFRTMGNPKIIGFTATAYRLEVGYSYQKVNGYLQLQASTMLKMLTRMRHKKATRNFWQKIIFYVSHKDLLKSKYLAPIEYIDKPLLPYAEIPVNKAHSDFDLELYDQSIVGLEANVLRSISEAKRRFKSVLVFCGTTEQAKRLQKTVLGSEIVLGETNKVVRAHVVERFKNHETKVVFNVGTLTTGFDHPALDCIMLLRPTRSLALYNQMLGRLTRPAPGKDKGTVIDFTGTVKALGRIETFELYQDGKVWDLKTEKRESWHNKVLFSRVI